MRRIQLIELHDEPWFPSSLRNNVTDALRFGLSLLKAYAPVAPLLLSALESTRSQSIVDVCSGSGGPWLDLSRKLQSETHVFHILLTDRYPNLRALQNVRSVSENDVAFYPDSVDAMKVPRELQGFRTMFTSFQHFAPGDARAILQNAVDARQSIGIFEITKRSALSIVLMFPWALTLFLFTPFIRPFRWSRLLCTYMLPIIPVVLLFDGVVSCLRTYRTEELREMIETLAGIEYQWEVDELSRGFGVPPVTYLIGYQL
jgi:hypothetical protein